MRRLGIALTAVNLLMLTAGCNIVGKWSLESVKPEAARRDFEFGSLTLQKDGSYYGEAISPATTSSGTYRFKNDTLTLTPHSGHVVTYDAKFTDADHIQLEKFWEGQKVKTSFKRVE